MTPAPRGASWWAPGRLTDQPARHLQDALHRVIGVGDDTDTTAAIAGQLLGARWGASAIPDRWRQMVHGWPGLRAVDLVDLALRTARGASGVR